MSGFLTRIGLAKILGVSPSRVSQLQAEGRIAQPEIVLDEKSRVWSESYGAELAGKKSGRRTSVSFFGLLPVVSPAPRISDAIVHFKEHSAFVQAFDVSGETLALVIPLRKRTDHPFPGCSQSPAKVSSPGDGSRIELLTAAAEQMFGGDPFGVSWCWVDDQEHSLWRLSDVVLVDEGDSEDQWGLAPKPTWRMVINDVTQDQLVARLGAPIPMLHPSISTEQSVEAWRAAGRTPTATVQVDLDDDEFLAASAALLMDVRGLEGREQLIAVSALLDRVRWERSGGLIEGRYVFGFESKVQWLVNAAHPNFSRFRDKLPAELLGRDEVSREEAAAACRVLSDLRHLTYGKWGKTPSPNLDLALHQASRRVQSFFKGGDGWGVSLLPWNYYTLRVTALGAGDRNAEAWARSLVGASESARTKPEARELLALDPGQRVAGGTDDLLMDGQGNLARLTDVLRYDNHIERRLTVAVPITHGDEEGIGGADFEQILVTADTQGGPLFIRTPRGVELMPFTKQWGSAGFTHGYGGSGPSNTSAAIQGFIEKAAGGKMTQAGRERLWDRVVGCSQGKDLVILRDDVIAPGFIDTNPGEVQALEGQDGG